MSKQNVTFGAAISAENFTDGLFEEEVVKDKETEDNVLLEVKEDDGTLLDLEDEEVVLEATPIIEEAAEDVFEIKDDIKANKYREYVQAFVASGEWVFDGIEDPETGEQIALEDLDIDEEMFNEIKKQQKAEIKAKAKEEVFSSLDETEKEFLEFKKNGGDLDKYYQTLNTKKQIKSIDISTDEGKVTAVRTYYQGVLKMSPEKTDKLISNFIKDMDIDKEAEEAKEKIDKIAEEQHNRVVTEQKERIREAEEARQKATETLKNTLKEEKVSVKEINNIVKGFTEMDERGLSEIDKHYLNLRNDPTKAKMVWDMLTNTDEFIKKMSAKEVVNKDVKTFKAIKLAKRKDSGRSNIEDDDFILTMN